MDLLIEKGNSRTYLSRYKVITTSFEESSPSVKRNNTQIQYRNGNVDFGGWHEAKKIDYVGYYRADDIDEEETLREKIYALLSDPNGYYITQLKNDNDNSYERPGENTGDYFEKQVNRPSHKRFYVYASSLESELVGSYGGHILYKIIATFTTMKLPYGESVPRDLSLSSGGVKPNYGENMLINTGGNVPPSAFGSSYSVKTGTTVSSKNGETTVICNDNTQEFYYRFMQPNAAEMYGLSVGKQYWIHGELKQSVQHSITIRAQYATSGGTWHDFVSTLITSTTSFEKFSVSFTIPEGAVGFFLSIQEYNFNNGDSFTFRKLKLEEDQVTPWSPAPSDSEYNKWYLDTHYLVIPYAGTVPCNQLEQGFTVEFTAKEAGSNLKLSLNGVDFIAPGNVSSGDIFKLSGYEYLRNGISIVKATNKAYFKLLPGIANKISSSIAGEIRILNFQNLYA